MGKEFQRALLWVILLGAMFVVWDNYRVSHGESSFFATPQQQTASQTTSSSVPSVGNKAVAPKPVSQEVEAVKDTNNLAVVTTDLTKVTFLLDGAQIVGNDLLKFPRQPKWTEVGLAGLVLGRTPEKNLGDERLMEVTPDHLYIAQTGLIANGTDVPNHLTRFKLVSKDLNMGDKDSLHVVFEANENGVIVTKDYLFTRGEYGVKLTTTVRNDTDKAIDPSVYYQFLRDDNKPDDDNTYMSSSFYGAAVYSSEEKFQKIKFSEIADKDATFVKNADNGWIAMVQHHFVSAWIPTENTKRENYVDMIPKTNRYTVGSIVSLGQVAPGATVSTSAVLYSGPQEQYRLDKYAPGLDLVVDYGWLTFLAKPIYWLLSFLHNIVGNWGWSIVLLTCIVKAILYPISAAGYRSMARMREVTPRMKALQERYKDDKQRLNQAMMELYKNEKINPVGGCLPIVLQIPVFLSLYWVLQGSVELRGAPWILWVHDLAVPDPWFILPLIMAGTMFLQIKLNPKPTDPMQARLMYIMPLVFSVMFFIFASGLVLYWLTNNVLSILQQWWINKTIAQEAAKKRA